MRRKVITTIILLLILVGAGAAIYVGVRLSQQTTAPDDTSAYINAVEKMNEYIAQGLAPAASECYCSGGTTN